MDVDTVLYVAIVIVVGVSIAVVVWAGVDLFREWRRKK